jgi:hypothetical protein
MKSYFFLSLTLMFGLAVMHCSEQLPTNSQADVEAATLSESFDADDLVLAKGSITALFELKLENLTPATGPGASQPFSPPVIASHGKFRVFEPGKHASKELAMIAEDAVNGPMVERLRKSKKVFDVVEGDDVVLPGTSATYMLEVKSGFTRISLVAMLVNSNDAFTGVAGLKPPRRGSQAYYLYAYDAGTEYNTENTSDIPGPCCGNPGVRVPSHDKIKKHRGILGTGDLDPAIYGWEGPVAKLTLTRVN